jgi:hypothetical protein
VPIHRFWQTFYSHSAHNFCNVDPRYVGANDAGFLGGSKLVDYLNLYSPAIRWFITVQVVGLEQEDPAKGQKRTFLF